jgi:hypothetical protein
MPIDTLGLDWESDDCWPTLWRGERYCRHAAFLHMLLVTPDEGLPAEPPDFPALGPGESAFSIADLAKTWRWDEREVSLFIADMRAVGWVETRPLPSHPKMILLHFYPSAWSDR